VTVEGSTTDTGKPKFFNDNLLLSADTITEPTAKMGTVDLMDYIKDGRAETFITLTDTADHVFEYVFITAQPLNFLQIKGCNANDYLVEIDTGSGYATLASGNFTALVDYVTWYSATTENIIGLKITFSHENYGGSDSVIVGDIIAAGQLYEFVGDGRYYPEFKIDTTENQNWLGSKRINKTRYWFECEIKIDGFTGEQQDDLDFVRVLQNRNTPFYIWLNGNRGDAAFDSLGECWKFDNIYRVYDQMETVSLGHASGQCDILNKTDEATIKLVEAAYVEEA
jgi:hypothetical protein